jgi:hypothetical protein
MVDDGDVSSIELGEQGFSYKEIVMRALQRASDVLSVEFRGGYYGGVDGVEYVIDSREVACSHVLVLAVLLLSKFDKVMEKQYKDFKVELGKLEGSFIAASVEKESVILGSDYYRSEKDKFLLEEFKIKKLKLHLQLFSDLSELLGRKKFLEMSGGSF